MKRRSFEFLACRLLLALVVLGGLPVFAAAQGEANAPPAASFEPVATE